MLRGTLKCWRLVLLRAKNLKCIHHNYQKVLNLLKSNGSIKHPDLHYVGRKPSASTAAGSPSNHKKELETFLNKLYS